jgi:hypothetical protein
MAFLPFEPMTACAMAAACLAGPVHPVASTFDLTMADGGARAAVSVTLTCDPTGGNHPKGEDACDALHSAGGDFSKLPKRKQSCTLEYAPVEVSAKGQWRGKPVEFHTKFSNRCEASAESSGVFDF